MYQTKFATSLSQKFPLETWLQRFCSVIRNDGLISIYYGDGIELYYFLNLRGATPYLLARMRDSQQIHKSFAEDEGGCYGVDMLGYSYLLMTDGCEFQFYWDPGGDMVGIEVWMDPSMMIHHSQHGEVDIRVVQ